MTQYQYTQKLIYALNLSDYDYAREIALEMIEDRVENAPTEIKLRRIHSIIDSLEEIMELKANDEISLKNEITERINDIEKNKKTVSKNKIAERICIYIDENYKDADLNRQKIADEFNFSVSFLSALVKKYTKTTIGSLINEKRLSFSAKLLENTDMKISDIAKESGFCSQDTFTKTFKKEFQKTPGEYRINKKINT